MVLCGQRIGLRAIRQAQMYRMWGVGPKYYSTKVSMNKTKATTKYTLFAWIVDE